MGDLSARRHIALAANPRTRGAITQREDVWVDGGGECWLHDQLIKLVDLESIKVSEECRRFYPGSPDHEFGWQGCAITQTNTIGVHLGNSDGSADAYAEIAE